ncbi:sensor histidine kinase [Streptomyces sp. NBC_00576]|uniref:sensor histidine kinase n=1 Tax=Streptomyces sp. NBC_00576 TaxID=2903665 RepID=UPI002E812872|nr:nitrate- and nitrite sensing domain-containing protein [Streptomyces sp. NBC_00576]WUB71123.1 nitrate- and nitrite sensing domain-containing protein [Streptomyces sp. NBC_00576]
MQKTRPRRTGRQTAPAGSATGGAPTDPAGRGRPAHVRNRLIVAVAVVAAAIAGAGAPSVVAASSQLHDSQDLVTLAAQTQDSLTLAHSLADERDEVTVYLAAGRAKVKAPSEQRTTRVDRQVGDLLANPDTPAALRADLDDIASLRKEALAGKSTALQAHETYSAAIVGLHRLAEQLAEQQPSRAGAGAYAFAELDSAVQQAAAARGLLLAALSVPTSTESVYDPVTGLTSDQTVTTPANTKQRGALSAAAQQARLRSDAALADFRESAPEAAVGSYDSTVTGPEVDTADKYLASLTDQPTLSTRELATGLSAVDAALSARVELMRGVESSLYDRRTKALIQLRDDDVTDLEIRIAALGALLLVAVGIATAMARTLTRPLSVLRRGTARLAEAADPLVEEPVKFTGRNDEFAQVVRSVNALHTRALAVHERIATLEADRKHLVGQRQKMADAREELRAELADAATQLARTRDSIHGTFVNLALRTLGLVERQLAVIEGLEEREQDPDRLATLFKLDHFATVMRRHSENLLVLAGAEHGHQHVGPVPLVDVVRAAVSEIERYERVRISALPPHAHLAGFAADDVSHLLAELLENATSFTPPELPVEISGWLLESGEIMLSVQDEGIGMTAERLVRLNSRLADFDPDAPHDTYETSETGEAAEKEGGDGIGLGLYVVARLAHRHGVRVQLREQKQGGVAAVVILPKALLVPDPAAVSPSATSTLGGSTLSFPGADAEVNSNVLQGRSEAEEPGGELEAEPDEAPADDLIPADAPDPMIALAERAVRNAEADAEADSDSDTGSDTDVPTPESDPAPLPASEITMELFAPEPPAEDTAEPTVPTAPDTDTDTETVSDPYAIGPDAHERAEEEPVTDKGLPKRTPKITAPAAPPRPRMGSVDAEALRRRLGGFQRGARDGHRDVEAEIAEQTGRSAQTTQTTQATQTEEPARTAQPARAEEATGGTVEEASS